MTATDEQAPEKPWQELEEDKRLSDATGVGIKVVEAGKVYQVHLGEMSGLDVAELRAQTGLSTSGLLRQAINDPDIDTIAAVVWLARWLAGDRPAADRPFSFRDVLAGMKWSVDGRSIEFVPAVPHAPPPVSDVATGEADRPEA